MPRLLIVEPTKVVNIMCIEILAPAGNLQSVIAAVRSGADAVYFGGANFNARRNADNFDNNALKEAIQYCKVNRVKSYLTLNILIKDSEIESAVQLVKTAYEFGIDGVIVQDIGFTEVLHNIFKDLPLHASTQMSVHSPAALNILKKAGFCRVVAAREMDKESLAALCKAAKLLDMEIEVFVHGALCMCLSGQCYFSAFLGGRSANRGLCAGTCRLPFSARGGTGYDLSLKDLCLVNHISELKKMGVSSLKIEGRMKRPEYVAMAVRCIKQSVMFGNVETDDIKLLQKAFSRSGFTDGYFTNTLGKNMFGVRTEYDKELSNEAMNKIHDFYRREYQRVPIYFSVTIKSMQPIKVAARCFGDNAVFEGGIPSKAINRPVDSEYIKNLLSKLGGTPYIAKEVTCDLEPGISVPAGEIKRLKNLAVEYFTNAALSKCKRVIPAMPVFEKLDFLKTEDHKKTESFEGSANYNESSDSEKSANFETAADSETAANSKEPANYRKINRIFLRFESIDQISGDIPQVYGYSITDRDVMKLNGILALMVKAENLSVAPAVELPRGCFDDEYIIKVLTHAEKIGIKKAVVSNLSELYIAYNMGFSVITGFGLNIYNSYSLKSIKPYGLIGCVVSNELSIGEISKIRSSKETALFSFCYGRQPLMLTKNCPVKNGLGCLSKEEYCKITDRKGKVFPVICRNGFSEILNCNPTYAADIKDKICADVAYLYFTTESKNDVLNIINDFTGKKAPKPPEFPFTRGLLKGGVL